MPFTIVRQDITKRKVDAIVNQRFVALGGEGYDKDGSAVTQPHAE